MDSNPESEIVSDAKIWRVPIAVETRFKFATQENFNMPTKLFYQNLFLMIPCFAKHGIFVEKMMIGFVNIPL